MRGSGVSSPPFFPYLYTDMLDCKSSGRSRSQYCSCKRIPSRWNSSKNGQHFLFVGKRESLSCQSFEFSKNRVQGRFRVLGSVEFPIHCGLVLVIDTSSAGVAIALLQSDPQHSGIDFVFENLRDRITQTESYIPPGFFIIFQPI